LLSAFLTYAICYVLLVWLIGRLEKQIAEIEEKVDVMLLKGDDNNNQDPPSLNGISLQNGKGGNSCHDGRGRRIEQ